MKILNKIFNNIKNLLSIGAKDRNHSFHTPVFSNNNDNNSMLIQELLFFVNLIKKKCL